ncbi:heme-binding protein [Ammoniphilus sp. CFH 90114]|uniref:GlcG/HbpS family heme-binding protein n=1 Tax=Ammoniphilus sp. CFH 90114 TaxID=2493665 RepID=UPI00100FE095|nr:heme-binding protein [Ammoniphilus sp. CFH 90114]RXT06996.1 heme-binding protein [Ammoniphilus sp. CFH 90114]
MEGYYERLALSQKLAMKMIEAACEKAEQMNIRVTVAVCDDGGNLKAFSRMDGAKLLGTEIAQNKAYTAASSERATADWYPLIEKNPALLHGIVHTNRLTIFGGGLPIKIENKHVGGIGVSGGTADEDVACAEAALSVMESLLREIS